MSQTIVQSAVETSYDLLFRVSPIILTGGVVSLIPGGALPIGVLTDSLGLVNGVITGTETSIDSMFAHFQTASGGTIISNEAGQYPFASQTVAANAIIQMPIEVSMIMECAPRGANYYAVKTATIAAMQATLAAHINAGGLFTVLTPHHVYENGILLRVTDVTPDPDVKPGTFFQFDFEFPLVTTTAASSVFSSLVNKLSGGQQTTGSWLSSATSSVSSFIGSVF